MRTSIATGASCVRPMSVEALEGRRLLSAALFDIDPTLSSITVSGSITAVGATASLVPQSSGSLTAKIDGTVSTDVTSSSIKFLAGSVLDAVAKPGPYSPGAVGADFAGKGSLNLGFFSVDLQTVVQNLKLDVTSGAITFAGSGFAANGVTAKVTAGTLTYEVPGFVDPSVVNLVGSSGLNNGAGSGSVVTSAGTATLTLPIKVSYTYLLSGGTGTATLNLAGKIVGKFVSTPTGGTISGTAYNDLNDNSAKDAGEVGLSAVTVYLDKNNNNVLDTGDVSKITDGSGNYSFTGLAAGPYTVREVVKAGFRQTSPAGGEYAVALTTGQIVTGKTFGNTQKVVIAGQKFNDANDNGVKDAGEAGLSGWTIYLDKNNNNVLDTGDISKTTDLIGQYVFRGLTAGSYTVREVAKTGWRQTTPTANGGEYAVTLGNAQGITTLNFGNTQKTRIAGTVFNDTNDNGVKDTGELGLASWQVYLDKNNNNVLDTGDVVKTTDAGGNYVFSNLTAGAHTVREVVKTGFRQTSPSGGKYAVTTALGQAVTGKTFGNTQKVRISGRVFNDVNKNAVLNTGEAGLAGVKVFLDIDNDGVWDTTEKFVLTDAGGNYTFANLTAGAFHVHAVKPSGKTQSTPTNNGSINLTLTAGQVATGKLFGFFA